MKYRQNIITETPELIAGMYSHTLFIYSETSMEKVMQSDDGTAHYIVQELMRNHVRAVPTSKLSYDNDETYFPGYNNIIALGGGTAIDYAKYIGANNHAFVVVIPSMLSTNAWSTDKCAIIVNGHKMSVKAKMPDAVVVDDSYLSLSSRQNLYGLVDIMSIYQASNDWIIANEDTGLDMTEQFEEAEELLGVILDRLKDVKLGKAKLTTDMMFPLITKAGYITVDYGGGRPESGSEHIFASTIETIVGKRLPHALAVSMGLIATSCMQGIDTKAVTRGLFLNDLGIISDINHLDLSESDVVSALNTLQPRSDKYTMIDRWVNDGRKGIDCIVHALRDSGIHLR